MYVRDIRNQCGCVYECVCLFILGGEGYMWLGGYMCVFCVCERVFWVCVCFGCVRVCFRYVSGVCLLCEGVY